MSMEKRELQKTWVRQLQDGSRSAFHELYQLYHQDIYAYAISLLKSKSLAKDLLQEVFIKIWEKREQLNPDLSFRSYIFTITRNMAFNTLAKAATQTKLKDEVFYKSQRRKTDTADYALLEHNYNKLKQKALENLTPRCRLVFEMSREGGKSYREISEELGVSENTVRNQISTALADIRMFLEKHGDVVFMMMFLMEMTQLL